jgi:glycosyltransferase involved in cell wall biosynthesis
MNIEKSEAEPLFSIITPTFNCGPDAINGTLQSVISQDYPGLEYLIIDGDSSDGTREWLTGIEDPRVRSWSE